MIIKVPCHEAASDPVATCCHLLFWDEAAGKTLLSQCFENHKTIMQPFWWLHKTTCNIRKENTFKLDLYINLSQIILNPLLFPKAFCFLRPKTSRVWRSSPNAPRRVAKPWRRWRTPWPRTRSLSELQWFQWFQLWKMMLSGGWASKQGGWFWWVCVLGDFLGHFWPFLRAFWGLFFIFSGCFNDWFLWFFVFGVLFPPKKVAGGFCGFGGFGAFTFFFVFGFFVATKRAVKPVLSSSFLGLD